MKNYIIKLLQLVIVSGVFVFSSGFGSFCKDITVDADYNKLVITCDDSGESGTYAVVQNDNLIVLTEGQVFSCNKKMEKNWAMDIWGVF